MAKTIAVCNQKGGVGKSTTAVNVASYLASFGKKTLLVDLDPQGNATVSLGVNRVDINRTVYETLVEDLSSSEVIIKSSIDRLELLPSSLDLAGAEVKLAQMPQRELILKNVCASVNDRYDVILMDCPPSLGLLTINALVASDVVLIPVQCEYLALEGLNALVHTIQLVKTELNPSLEIGGIVLTMVDARSNLTKEVADEVKRFFKDLVCTTQIPRNVRLAECPSHGKPIMLYDAHSSGAEAYAALTNELLAKVIEKPAPTPSAVLAG